MNSKDHSDSRILIKIDIEKNKPDPSKICSKWLLTMAKANPNIISAIIEFLPNVDESIRFNQTPIISKYGNAQKQTILRKKIEPFHQSMNGDRKTKFTVFLGGLNPRLFPCNSYHSNSKENKSKVQDSKEEWINKELIYRQACHSTRW